MIAFGWTITRQRLDMEDLDITLPIGCFILVLHLIIGGLMFLDSEEAHKTHYYQGVQGIMLIIFRLCMYLAFLYGIWDTKDKVARNAQKSQFLNLLLVSGTLYFMALPISILLSKFALLYN